MPWLHAFPCCFVLDFIVRIEPDPTSFRFEGELGYLFEGEDGNLTCAPNASNLNVTWLYTTASGDQLPNVSAVGSTLVITAAPLSLNNEEVTCVAENGTANATTSYLLRVVGESIRGSLASRGFDAHHVPLLLTPPPPSKTRQPRLSLHTFKPDCLKWPNSEPDLCGCWLTNNSHCYVDYEEARW